MTVIMLLVIQDEEMRRNRTKTFHVSFELNPSCSVAVVPVHTTETKLEVKLMSKEMNFLLYVFGTSLFSPTMFPPPAPPGSI